MRVGMGMAIASLAIGGCAATPPAKHPQLETGAMVEPIMRYRFTPDTHRISCAGGCGYSWDAPVSDTMERMCDECAGDSDALDAFLGRMPGR